MTTVGELLKQSTGPVMDGSTLRVDARLELGWEEQYAIDLVLNAEKSLVGLTVLTPEGGIAGVIPRTFIQDYLQDQLKDIPELRGGGTNVLLSDPVISNVPFYRCKRHTPPYQCLSWEKQPKCPECGHLMERVRLNRNV